MTFTHIQVQSSYTLLQSPMTTEALVAAAKARGYSAIALTDVNVLYGSVEFYQQAIAAGIKPLLGLTIQAADARLLVIAENDAGYHQLLKISSALKLAETLPKLAELPAFTGLAAVVPGEFLLSPALREQWGAADDLLAAVQTLAPAHLYVGVSAKEATSELPAFAQARELPLIALGDVAYVEPTDAFAAKVMQTIDQGDLLNLRDPTLMDAGDRWLTPPDTAAAPFLAAGLQQAVANTDALAARASVSLQFEQLPLPHFDTPQGESSKAYLRTLSETGLHRRFASVAADYQARLDYELGVIDSMGFDDYFLIVWDVVRRAHVQGIMTGPGRGSAAGSLVAYALGITEVDPLEYGLLFERFLNPARQQMPDIDLDFPDNRRAEMIQYVHDRYGDDHMSQIITFGTFGAKQALRDVCRVFGISQYDSNKWSAVIPSDPKVDTLKKAYDKSQGLRNLVADSEQNQQIFAVANQLEGLPRHDSTHAAGVVLAAAPLIETVALQTGTDGFAQTQLPKAGVEALGLLKIDFLGVRNLTVLTQTQQAVSDITGKPFALKAIPLDDAKTLQLFARGDTTGIFQFEHDGMRNALRTIAPTTFEDIVAVDALYRPGPMKGLRQYAARKHGEEPVAFAAPELAPILSSTYGVLVYQEQVMQVASAMGGFSLAEADVLRRAISKKHKREIDEQRARFIQGAMAKGHSQASAQTVYDYIERFADYGFNRSHAVAYSLVAFWQGYLRVHYPAAFFAALMTTASASSAKMREYVGALRQAHVPVLAPDINLSERNFTLQNGGVRFGFAAIKGLRRDFIDALLAARARGPFKDLRDLLSRLETKWLKSDIFAPLVYAGAFDGFDANRAKTLANLNELIDSIRLSGNNMELFAVLAPKPTSVPEMSAGERLDQEIAVLGVFLSAHPVDRYTKALSFYQPLTQAAALVPKKPATMVVLVRRIKQIRTKKGDEMAFIDGQDTSGEVDITVFPRLYKEVKGITAGQVIVVSGNAEQGDGPKLLASHLVDGDAALAALPKQKLYLRVSTQPGEAAYTTLLKTLEAARGPVPVIAMQADTRQTTLLPRRYWVQPSQALQAALETQLGAGSAVVKG